jgi:3-oxoadipate enol-lactonase
VKLNGVRPHLISAGVPACLDDGPGEGAGNITVYLLHGVGGGKEVWPDAMKALVGAGYRAVAWDMPGYGASPAIDPFDNAGLAHSLERLIDAIDASGASGARRNILLGHSMGGMIAQEAIALFPQKIHGLILSGTSPAFGKPGGDWQQQFLQSRFAPLDAGRGMAGLAPELARGMMSPSAGDAAVAQAVAIMSRVPEATYRAALAAIVSFNRLDNLVNIKVPAICISGEHDKNAAPFVMEKMAARIPGAEYVCLKDAGHIANMEKPVEFNAAVLDFLRRHFPQE